MTIVVSGGTGFVGRFVVEDLLDAGHSVRVLGRTPPAPDLFSRPVEFAEASLDPERNHSRALDGVAAFVHAAFDHAPGKYRGGEGDDPDGFRRRNLDGTLALFEAAKWAGARRCVFLSSRAVYGRQEPGVVLTEETEPQTDTLYGAVKLAAEKRLAAMSDEGFAGVSLRITGVYGEAGQGRPHKWSGLFADYRAGRAVTPRVATEVHGQDVAAAARLVLDAPAAEVSGAVFNVSDIVVDRRDLLALVRDATSAVHPLPERADASALNVPATERLRALGWRPGGRALLERSVRAMCRGL